MTAFDRNEALGFLTYVYAGRPGWLQVVDSGRNFFGQGFPTTPDGIAAAVAYAAGRDADQPQGIYFRATTMNTPTPKKPDGSLGRGGADITDAVPMLWADLDYGDEGHKRPPVNPVSGKEQAPNPPTEDDARGLVAAAGLPEPTVWVHSGGGLYPLWVLAEQVDTDRAARLSEGIQEAIARASAARGWHYGTGVSDLARVLRLPGSVNRKTDNPRPCRVVDGTWQPVPAELLPLPLPKAAPTPKAAPRTTTTTASSGGGSYSGDSVFDALADNTEWADILEPADWTFVASESGGSQRWLRPGGADSEYSARTFEHNLVCHSESAGLPSGAGQRLTKGRVFAWLWHNGDVSEAAKDLIRAANGNGGSTGALSLPSQALDAIRKASDPWAAFGFDTSIPVAGQPTPTNLNPLGVAGAATDEELRYFLAAYTRFTRPDRLGRRAAWLSTDEPRRLGWHARCMVQDVLDGHYPAERAVAVLADAYKRHGGQDPAGHIHLLRVALGAILNAKVSA